MKGFLRAFKECISSPVAVITNGYQWMIFLIIEMITLALVLLIYKKCGRFIGISQLFWVIALGIFIGYIIHFVVIVIFVGSFYNGSDFIP